MKLRYEHCSILQENLITTQWEEEENPEDSRKCDKITLTLAPKDKAEETLLTITIMVNKGRIHVQGRLMKIWSNVEFPTLIDLINNPEIGENDCSLNLQNFTNDISILKKDHLQQTPPSPQDQDTSPNKEPKSEMKISIASLEADFVLLKQTMEKEITKLNTSLNQKEQEMHDLKIKNTTLTNEIKEYETQHGQQFGDLLLQQETMKEEMNHMSKKYKALEEKYSNLLSKTSSLSEKMDENQANEAEETAETNNTSVANIPTLNRFDQLDQSDHSSEESHASTPENLEDIPPPTNTNHQENHADNIKLCDSNGRYLKPNLLCPDGKTSYLRCPTLTHAKKIVENTNFTSLKTLILHTGTNDLEHPPQNETVANKIEEIAKYLSNKYPNNHIVVSSLLPRKDAFNKQVNTINESLKKALSPQKM
jgi:hypothetical protein